MNKKLIASVLSIGLAISAPVAALGDQEADVRYLRDKHYAQLESTEDRLYELAAMREDLQNQISELNYELVDIWMQISEAENGIELTKEAISTTESDIATTETKLAKAEKKRDAQYEDMKLRIQYIYENGGDAGWAVQVLETSDLTDFFNKAEYAASVQEADRKALHAIAKTVRKINKLKGELEAEKGQLVEQQESLEVQKVALEEKDYELSCAIERKQAQSEDYAWQIEEARDQAYELARIIQEETIEIRQIQYEKQQEAIRAAQEEARRQAAAAAAAAEAERRAAAEEDEDDSDYDEDESYDEDSDSDYDEDEDYDEDSDSDYDEDEDYDEDSDSDYDEDEDYDEDSDSDYDEDEDYDEDSDSDYDEDEDYDYDEDEDGDYDTDIEYDDDDDDDSSSSIGQDIIDYADQFVGNPYVWGGSSLTEGADCSHFVWLVLKDMGVDIGDYKTSSELPYYGEKVNSLDEARAGDVICYSGHVALYDGNGGIVEAKGAKWGITHDRAADHGTIVGIRRFT